MLIEFKFKNFRSFRDETILSMESYGLKDFKSILIDFGSMQLLPGVGIYGKNGGGKSNVIRAFWLAVQFIKNAQRTQHENSPIPVVPFLLNDYSRSRPTEFEFVYTIDGTKYQYGFAADKEKIIWEYLYHSPKGQKATVFSRNGQEFYFTVDKPKRTLISEVVAKNQLFFAVACTMNDADCINAMRWFRELVLFSRDYSEIPRQLIEYSDDKNMLKSITDYAKVADVGINDMRFEFKSTEISNEESIPREMPEELKNALSSFMKQLSETSNNSEMRLKVGEMKATSFHFGKNQDGKVEPYPLDLSDESDGTRKLMSLAPAIESSLQNGGVLLVDEIEREMHPILLEFIISRFQSKKTNPNGAQLIFTTHNTELLNMELLRKDQIYFADKGSEDGVSELYSVIDMPTQTSTNIRKSYLLGKFGAIPNIEIAEVE